MLNPDSHSEPQTNESETAEVKPIQTQRLLLRGFANSDAARVELLLDDKEIASNTRHIDYPYPKGGGAQWIATHEVARQTGEGYVYAICRLEDPGCLMGAIGLQVNKIDHNAELGYWIGREFWNQGVCTEAAQAVIEFGFETVGLRRICSEHLSRNPASGRVMEKAGMTREGLRRKHTRKWGVFEDVVIYGILSDDPRP